MHHYRLELPSLRHYGVVPLLVLIVSVLNSQSVETVNSLQLIWQGGPSPCDDRSCVDFEEHFPSYSGNNEPEWNDGLKGFEIAIADKVIQVNVTLYGRFRCTGSKPRNVIKVLVSETQVGAASFDAVSSCTCFNCAEFIQFGSPVYSNGWPGFIYTANSTNTLRVEATGVIYASALELILISSNGSSTTTATSTTTSSTTGGHTTTTTTGHGTTTKHHNSTTTGGTDGPEILLPVEDIIGIIAVSVAVVFIGILFCFCGVRMCTAVIYGGKKEEEVDEERRPLMAEWDPNPANPAYRDGRPDGDSIASTHSQSGVEKMPMADSVNMAHHVVDMREIEMKEVVGRGSFADVYHGVWFGTDVAVKRVPVGQEELFSDFQQEADMLSTLRHPNVLQLIGVAFDEEGDLCIVTEFMSRGCMHSVLHDPSIEVLRWRNLRKMLVGACKGMVYLHARVPQIVHRDLKPHNLLVDENWKCKVCDFGLATMASAKAMRTACGTPSYSAPEVLRQERYTEKADVYSFGMVMWECVTRSHPYARMPPFHIVYLVGSEGERPDIPGHVPPPIANVIARCWAENPDERPDFTDVLKMLKSREACKLVFGVELPEGDSDSEGRGPSDEVGDEGGASDHGSEVEDGESEFTDYSASVGSA